jgi:membrane protein
VVALWSASSGTSALIEAVNVAYDETERRGFFRRRALALAMAVGLIVFGIVALFVITALPLVFERVGFGDEGRTLLMVLRWPVLALLAMVGLSVLYRFAPNRSRAQWRWLSVGAVVATIMWIAASLLLSLWVSSFGNYGATYGTLAGVIVLMLWMLFSTLSILVGAEINSELEAQTAVDSTTGPPKPMGQRGAQKADTLGESFG